MNTIVSRTQDTAQKSLIGQTFETTHVTACAHDLTIITIAAATRDGIVLSCGGQMLLLLYQCSDRVCG